MTKSRVELLADKTLPQLVSYLQCVNEDQLDPELIKQLNKLPTLNQIS